MRVAIRRLDFDDIFADFEDRDIKGAATKIEYGNLLVLLLVHPIGERRSSRLIDDSLNIETRDFARILSRLALRVIEVRGHRDDRCRDCCTQVRLSRSLQLAQDHR